MKLNISRWSHRFWSNVKMKMVRFDLWKCLIGNRMNMKSRHWVIHDHDHDHIQLQIFLRARAAGLSVQWAGGIQTDWRTESKSGDPGEGKKSPKGNAQTTNSLPSVCNSQSIIFFPILVHIILLNLNDVDWKMCLSFLLSTVDPDVWLDPCGSPLSWPSFSSVSTFLAQVPPYRGGFQWRNEMQCDDITEKKPQIFYS